MRLGKNGVGIIHFTSEPRNSLETWPAKTGMFDALGRKPA